ncbi:MAG: zinc-binding dehydrogenase [Acidobacteriota bacterium]|nr:MAG: zinc-binding dehydrogenase [Acidobacteriota bacterium]
MKAILIERFGPPEVLVEREVPSPKPVGDEIKVRVRASGLNFADLLQRLHLYGNAPGVPYIPGFEVSGEVIACGPEVTRFQEGQRAVALTRFGGYAEEVCVSEQMAEQIPDSMGFESAAAVPVTYLTAWFCLVEMAHIADGERVLIQGGSGGVGTAAIQIAQLWDTTIYSTAGSSEKLDFLRRAGVANPINYRTQDFAAEIRRLTNEEGIDVVIDSLGGTALQEAYNLLRPLGRLVSYGLSSAVSGPGRNWLKTARAVFQTPKFKPLDMIGRNVGVFGFHLALLGSRSERAAAAFKKILDFIDKGRLEPIVGQTFPLSRDGAVAAHHYMHGRRNIGKILLTADS